MERIGPSPRTGRAGFTLIELLVVIAIMAVLIALLLPAVQRVREAASTTACRNNLKQMVLALHHYHDQQGSLPPGAVPEYANWAILILPYLEQDALYRSYNLGKKNTDPVNRNAIQTLVKTYVCPSDSTAPFVPTKPESGHGNGIEYMPGSYRAVSGKTDAQKGWFDSQKADETKDLPYDWRGPIHVVGRNVAGAIPLVPERLADIRDGLSSTLLVGENTTRTHPRRRSFWAYSWNQYSMSMGMAQARLLFENDYDRCAALPGTGGETACKRGWGSFHIPGINFAHCDGSVRVVTKGIDLNLFTNLTTIAGGEPMIPNVP